MLLTNYSYINQICGHTHSGTTNPYWIISAQAMRGYYGGQQNDGNLDSLKKDSLPTGTESPYALIMGDDTGLMSATTTLYQSNSITYANLAGGLNGDSAITGSGDISVAGASALAYLISSLTQSSTLTADITGSVEIAATLAQSGDLVGALGAAVSILADLNGDGDLTGDIAGALEATATLAQSGDLVGAIAGAVEMISTITGSNSIVSDIVGVWDMQSDITATSTFVADIIAIADMITAIIGENELTIADGAIPGSMDCIITNESELSPTSLAAAVWESIAANFNNAGTMGEIMNNMGSVADPWSTTIPASYPVGSAGYILGTNLDEPVSSVGGSVTHKQIADAVWNQIKYGYMNEETFGKLMQDILNNTTK